MRRFFVTAAVLFGCGSEQETGPMPLVPETLSLEPVAWSAAPWSTPVTFVHETASGTALCTSESLAFVAGGVLAGHAAEAKGCNGGARVAASDGTGQWDLVTAQGTIWRVAADGTTESVAARYGLEAKKVASTVTIDDEQFAIQYQDGFAVVSKSEVKLFAQVGISSIAGASGKFAYLTKDTARVLDTKTGQLVAFTVTDAKGAAFDSKGRLIVTAASTVYREVDGALAPLLEGQATLGAPRTSGGKVWITSGAELLLLEDDRVFKTSGLALDAATTIYGSSSGDVWLSRSSGVTRLRHGTAGNALEQKWQADVLPIYAKVCSACHGPTGSAKIDLSSYNSWVSRKAALSDRLVVLADMPPAGVTLSADDRSKLAGFVAAIP
jgi:hypothetical protein